MRAYYFGCRDHAGHCLYDAAGGTMVQSVRYPGNNPWGLEIDGGLCPGGRDHRSADGVEQPEGRALIHRKDGWTALAFWDRSLDPRPNSCSVFLVEGTHDFASMLTLAKRYFPMVVARFKFQITPAVDKVTP